MNKQELQHKLSGFKLYLLTNGYLNEDTAHSAVIQSESKNLPFTTCLVKENHMSHLELAEATASYFGLPFFNLNDFDVNLSPKSLLSATFILRHSVLPLYQKEKSLFLAVSDPSLVDINEINFLTGLTVCPIIVESDKLLNIIERLYTSQLKVGTGGFVSEKNNDSFFLTADSHPVVKFLNDMLLDATHKKASDIHLEPFENDLRIRYRIDGVLHEIDRQSLKFANFLTTRLKIMANLDISERRLPQDGRFKLPISKHRTIDFRLNLCPTLHGEKVVIRLLESSKLLLDPQKLGMNLLQQDLFLKAISNTEGMILVTGPTGSGKTVTLYSAIQKLNTSEVNILSVEDPIEIHLNGINQVQTNKKIGLTFATVLRTFLRQDPDIIMVGEIRDSETADVAVRAAQTGHLVFSTLHANNAVQTLTRLQNLGIEPFQITSSISLIIAQRLVRRLCPNCKEKILRPKDPCLIEELSHQSVANISIYQARGCNQCYQGYQGRIGIYEVLPISQAMSKLIFESQNYQMLQAQAQKENIASLRQAGIEKVMAGITSLDEIRRVIYGL